MTTCVVYCNRILISKLSILLLRFSAHLARQETQEHGQDQQRGPLILKYDFIHYQGLKVFVCNQFILLLPGQFEGSAIQFQTRTISYEISYILDKHSTCRLYFTPIIMYPHICPEATQDRKLGLTIQLWHPNSHFQLILSNGKPCQM